MLQKAPHPLVKAAGYAIDALDIGNLQIRTVKTTTGIIIKSYTHDTLYNANDPSNWVELPKFRSPGVLYDTQELNVDISNTTEYRVCTSINYGCL